MGNKTLLLSFYGWDDANRAKCFETWEEEIEHVEAQGYQLVPYQYYIPHWTSAMGANPAFPDLYLYRPGSNQVERLMTHLDCYASKVGYPLYYKPEDLINRPVTTIDMNEAVLAGALYEAYCDGVDNVAFNGDPLPNWEAFSRDEKKAKQVNAWMGVARKAVEITRMLRR